MAALSIALRHLNKGYPSISKCLFNAYKKNVTTLAVASTTKPFMADHQCNNISNKNLILPTVRHLSTPCLTKNSSILLDRNRTVMLSNIRNMSAQDHRALWKVERVVSLALLGLLPACVAFPNVIIDNLTTIAVVAHIHWGLEAIAQDYLRPVLVGQIISKAALLAVYLLTITTLGGLLFFNYTDVGLGQFVRDIWAL